MDESSNLIPKEQPCAVDTAPKSLSIGLPACNPIADRRFPLTPEVVEMLAYHFTVIIEKGAPKVIHYAEEAYTCAGARIADRDTALHADIVISIVTLTPADISKMRRGAVLLTLSDTLDKCVTKRLLEQRITTIFLDRIKNERGNRPVADLLAEINGRAAMMKANELLADSCHGKGILIGGITGVIPCETIIIGSGIAAIAAAESAVGLGSIVKIFGKEMDLLVKETARFKSSVIPLFPHDRLFFKTIKSADVVIVVDNIFTMTDPSRLKKGVVIVDVSANPGASFPTMPKADLLNPNPNAGGGVCYTNAGKTVPRTVAMAFGSAVYPLLMRLNVESKSVADAMLVLKEMKSAIATFAGRVTNHILAEQTGLPEVDINLFLNLS